jgi:hypothetical protein
MSDAERSSGYGEWPVQPGPFAIRYPIGLLHEIDFNVKDAARRISHGGMETGGFLFGRTATVGQRETVKIEAFRAIDCEHAFGPSFVLSERDMAKMREQLLESGSDPGLEGMRLLGWFVGHARNPLRLSEHEASLFDRLFPRPSQLTLLVKPERFAPSSLAFIVRGPDRKVDCDGTKFAFPLPPLSAPVTKPVDEAPEIVIAVPAKLDAPLPEALELGPPVAQVPAETPVMEAPSSPPRRVETGRVEAPRAEPVAMKPPPVTEPVAMEPPAATELVAIEPPAVTEPFAIKPPPVTEPVAIEPPPLTEPVAVKPPPVTEPVTVKPPPATEYVAMKPAPVTEPDRLRPVTEAEGTEPVTSPVRVKSFPAKPLGFRSMMEHPAERNAPEQDHLNEEATLSRPAFERFGGEVAPGGGFLSLEDLRARRLQRLERSERLEQFEPSGELAPRPATFALMQRAHTGLWKPAVALLAALILIGTVFHYYEQYFATAVPLEVDDRVDKLMIFWPADETRDAGEVSIRVDEGQPLQLSMEEKVLGRAEIAAPGNDVRVELVVHHWYGSVRGRVRFLRPAITSLP